MKRTALSLMVLLFAAGTLHAGQDRKLQTVAEKSEYTKTSSHSDVMSFITELQKQTSLVRVQTLCMSPEGRKVPLLIIGDPVPSSPADIQKDNRLVVYIQANIHAGEVEGKEAALALARDMTTGTETGLLKDMVVLMTPIFNADGNEKFSDQNRQSQNGPKEVGVRYNGQQLDLNRDAIKLESPEVTAMVTKILNTWDPALLIDCHTTNGSYHQEPVTYVWGYNPNGDPRIIDFMRTKMNPYLKTAMEKDFGILAVEYGNFMDYRNPGKGWTPAGPQVRYITNYTGLRNRLAILDENYTHADYKTRVKGAYALLHSSLTFCSRNKEDIQNLLAQADAASIQRGIKPAQADSFIVEYNQEAYDKKITLRAYDFEIEERENSWPRIKKLDTKKTLHLPYYAKYTAKRSVKFPFGYLIPVYNKTLEQKLLQHGLVVEKLTEPVTLSVEEFSITDIKSGKRPYQGHYLCRLTGTSKTVEKTFGSGTLFVPTGQRLGSLAAYLCEPEMDDGLVAWNFFDRFLVSQWGSRFMTLPVYRVMAPANLAAEQIVQ